MKSVNFPALSATVLTTWCRILPRCLLLDRQKPAWEEKMNSDMKSGVIWPLQ